ncbi:MAG TPA: hypothetical protein VGE52_15005, partial [Pirellulales bacterium]
MAALTEPPTFQLSASVRRLLDALRTRIRAYVWFEGTALLLAFVGLSFWLTFGLDRWRELPVIARIVMIGLFAVGLVYLFVRAIALRAFTRISDRSLAVLLERKFPQFGDSLQSAVELSERDDLALFDQRMLERTFRTADARSQKIELGEIFNPLPLARNLGVAVLLFLSIAAFASASPREWGVWKKRWLTLDDSPWPRSVLFQIVEPHDMHEADGSLKPVKRALGAPVKFVVRASLNKEEFPEATFPQLVSIHFQGGDRNVRAMDRQGEPTQGFQEYTYEFPDLEASQVFDLRGADGYLPNVEIEAVEAPRIVNLTLKVRYPKYMQRLAASLKANRAMALPRGTQVELVAETNKELVGAVVKFAHDEGSFTVAPAALAADRKSFSLPFRLDGDRRLLFQLSDADGIVRDEPEPLTITAVNDEPPTVAVRLKGVGTSVTPMARLPILGTITDEYGLAEAWYEYAATPGPNAAPVRRTSVELVAALTAWAQARGFTTLLTPDLPTSAGSKGRFALRPPTFADVSREALALVQAATWTPKRAQRLPFPGDVERQMNLELTDEAFEIRTLGLAPGDKLSLQLKVRDAYQLGGGPGLAALDRILGVAAIPSPPATGRLGVVAAETAIWGLETFGFRLLGRKPLGPNEAVGEKFAFEIVTPDELRQILEMRVLNYRVRFEAIVAEAEESRTNLSTLLGASNATPAKPAEGAPASPAAAADAAV